MPSFVLEFLLARYCASDDPREIQEGMAAVLETIQKNYVRPDESNKAQMIVQQKGKHTFIDKIHVKYSEDVPYCFFYFGINGQEAAFR